MGIFEGSDWLRMWLPIAGVGVFWPGLVLLGFAAGAMGGGFGIGGAWLVAPALNILGLPMAFAIGTGMAHVAGGSFVSLLRRSRCGGADYKRGVVLLAGSIIGIECGARLVLFPERLGSLGSVVRWSYMVLLPVIAWKVFHDSTGVRRGEAGFSRSLWSTLGAGLAAGLPGGWLGIGNGALQLPVLKALSGRPAGIAVGTDLFAGTAAGLFGVFSYALKGRMEIVGVLILVTGAAIGAQVGTLAARYAQGYPMRLVFGLAASGCTVSVAFKEFAYDTGAAALMLATIGILCLFIAGIVVQGARSRLLGRGEDCSSGSTPARG